jgi:hypothetical protein
MSGDVSPTMKLPPGLITNPDWNAEFMHVVVPPPSVAQLIDR